MQGSITLATLQAMGKVADQCSKVLPAICSSVSWSACKMQDEAINNTPNSVNIKNYPIHLRTSLVVRILNIKLMASKLKPRMYLKCWKHIFL